MFKGFLDRFRKEMITLAPKTMSVNVVTRKRPDLSAWIGGSILSSLTIF